MSMARPACSLMQDWARIGGNRFPIASRPLTLTYATCTLHTANHTEEPGRLSEGEEANCLDALEAYWWMEVWTHIGNRHRPRLHLRAGQGTRMFLPAATLGAVRSTGAKVCMAVSVRPSPVSPAVHNFCMHGILRIFGHLDS